MEKHEEAKNRDDSSSRVEIENIILNLREKKTGKKRFKSILYNLACTIICKRQNDFNFSPNILFGKFQNSLQYKASKTKPR